jgi:hypothetical protein
VQLYANILYSYDWNTTIKLGPANHNAHYDITTKSGFPTQSIVCDNEDNVIMDVGGKNTSVATSSTVPESFSANKNELAAYLGEKYKVDSKMFSKDAMVNNFYKDDSNDLILTQQNGSPILIADVNEDDFVSYNEKGFKYELGHFNNADEVKMNVVRFKANGVYMALVTDLAIEEALKIAHSFTKAPGNR